MTFGFATTTDDVLDGVDLTGRVAIVTGAASGLGFETARALAATGAHVVATARDRTRADDAVARLRVAAPAASFEAGVVDLASLASVHDFAVWFAGRHEHLHLLINNAGVMATPFERTTDGFELQFGTNHLGHFLVTCLLTTVLAASAPARIVNLSSAGHFASDIDFDDPNYHRRPYNKWEAYGQSKTANILCAVGLELRLGAHDVHAYAVHPGMIATELGRHITTADREELAERAKKSPAGKLPSYKPVAAGAATSVWAATAPELAAQGGTYLADCQVSTEHALWALDPDRAERLWVLSEKLVG